MSPRAARLWLLSSGKGLSGSSVGCPGAFSATARPEGGRAGGIGSCGREAAGEDPSIVMPEKGIKGSEWVFEQAVAGNEWAIEIFKKQGFYLGIVLAGLINCLNPEVIVIGGGAAAAWDMFYPALVDQVKKRTYADASARARIVPAALGDNAGIFGAAQVGFQNAMAARDVAVK